MRIMIAVACVLLVFAAGCARGLCSDAPDKDECCVQKGIGNTFDEASGKCITLLGTTCGTVSPGYRDECCVSRGQGNRYDPETDRCMTV